MRFKIIVAAAAVISIAFAATGVIAAPPGGMQMPPPPVEVATVTRAPLFLNITAVGSLAANESVMLRPEVDGQIVKINFEEGQPVKAGTELIMLDQSIMSAEAKRAVSGANLGDANLRRAQELKKAGYATQRSLDEARTEATSNISAAAVAKVRLDKTTIRAPFDGTAGFRSVSLGDYVRTGDSLLNFEQTDPIKATFQVPETYLTSIKDGTPVEIRVDAYPTEVFQGTINAINPAIDRQTRSIAIRAKVANADGRLRPGLFARVSIPVDQSVTSLVVPETALIPQGNKMVAFRIKDKKAERVEVKMGQRNNGLVEVKEGLSEGDEVVVTGQMRVMDGVEVNVVNTVPAVAPSNAPKAPAGVAEVQPVSDAPNTPSMQPAEVPIETAPQAIEPTAQPTIGAAIEPVSPTYMPPLDGSVTVTDEKPAITPAITPESAQ